MGREKKMSDHPEWVKAALKIDGLDMGQPSIVADCKRCSEPLLHWCDDIHSEAHYVREIDGSTACIICNTIIKKYHGKRLHDIDKICKGEYCNRIKKEYLAEYKLRWNKLGLYEKIESVYNIKHDSQIEGEDDGYKGA